MSITKSLIQIKMYIMILISVISVETVNKKF